MPAHKLLWVALFLLIAIPFVAAFSTSEDFATVRATVVRFEPGTVGSSFVTLRLEEISNYTRSIDADYPIPTINTDYTFGYLWGHRPVDGTFPPVDIGAEITANLSFHHQFSSHVGHLYSYGLICGEGEFPTEKGCAPSECAEDEVLVGTKCVQLECDTAQGYLNHTCYDLDCKTDEKVENHRCVSLMCADDELASDHLCQKLDCGIDKVAKGHMCVPIICGVFKKVDNHACVLDGSQLIAFIAVMAIILYLIYSLLIQDLFSEKKKGERALANRIGIIFVFLVSLIVLALPAVSRLIFHSSLLIGGDSYQTQLVATQVMDGTLKLSVGGEVTIYHLLLAYLGGIFGLNLVAHLLPILLGTFSATLFYLIMRKIIDDVRVSTLTTMVLIFSPAFLYLYSTSTIHSMLSLLILVGVYLALSSRRMSVLAGGSLLALVSTYDPFVFAISFVAYLTILIHTRNNRRLRLALLAVVAFAGLISGIFFQDYIRPIASFRADLVRQSITDLGGTVGFGLFPVILLFSGLLYTWEKKREYAPVYLMLALLFVLMLALDMNYNAYLNFVVVYFIGFALSRFADVKWEAQQLKNIALLILFCGLLFSTISYAKRMSIMDPDPQLEEALTKLSEYPEGKVLSAYTYSDYIAYFAKMPPYIPSEGEGSIPKKEIAEQIFNSRRLDSTQRALESEGIRYILVDRKMRQGLVWDRDDQGLLFLFRNEKSFKRLYGNEASVEVWEFIPQNATLPPG